MSMNYFMALYGSIDNYHGIYDWGGEAYFRRRLLAFYDVVGQLMTSS